jgi:putative ABC transport system permease protein
MTSVALKGLLGRKVRTILTAIAIVLGVAMVSGSFVLTDSIERAFSSIFSNAYEDSDAVVSGRKLLDWSQSGRAVVAEEVLADVRTLPEVANASGTILDLSGDTNQAKILDRNGKPITGDNPTFGLGVDSQDEEFSPFELVEGAWGARPGEVVIDKATASEHGFSVGDRVEVGANGPTRSFELVGIAKIGGVDSIGGATFAIWDIETAQAMLGKAGYDVIAVQAAEGVSQEALVDAIAPRLPQTALVQTGEQQAEEDAAGVAEFVKFIRYFLLAFGGIALFVGAFVIFNTLSITIAQRTRELATLRTLGASRRQVLRSVVLEGTVIGALASAVGVTLGILLAKGLSALFAALDLDLPQSGTIVQPRTVIVSLLVGTLVTLVASVWPAVRATRIAPISAVREGGAVVKRLTTRSLLAALVVSGLSAAALSYGLLGNGVGGSTRALGIGLGALGLFVGIALLAPRLVRPLAAFVGAPAERFGGAAGRLARENAVRKPSRTAATAAALMIGLTLVTFVATFGRGLIASDEKAIRDQLATSHVITSQSGWNIMPVDAAQALAGREDVSLVSSVRADRAKLDAGREVDVNGVDPTTIDRGYRFEWKEGSDAVWADLGRDGAVVRDDLAKDEALAVGDTVGYLTPSGKKVEVVIRGIYEPGKFDPLLGHVLVSQAAFDASFPRPGDMFTFVEAASSANLERALVQFPDTKVQTQDEFVKEWSAWLGSMMNLFYVLLALSVIVSLFGMVNTLVLAVFERTREVGMLRAVGMTRRQTRRMIRAESVITALIGAALGIPLGIALAALVTQSLAQFGATFSLPVGTIAVFAVVAVFAGIVAAIMPARRAARLNVLEALQYE